MLNMVPGSHGSPPPRARSVPRPRVERIEGLRPAIAIQQGARSHNPRSTVATITEIHDYLRVLYATIGHPHWPRCDRPLQAQSRQAILDQVRALNHEQALQILAPVVVSRRGQFRELLADLRKRDEPWQHVPLEIDNPRQHPRLEVLCSVLYLRAVHGITPAMALSYEEIVNRVFCA